MNPTITMIARLICRIDGAAYCSTFNSPLDPADALIRACEQFGSTHQVRVVYPEERRWRIGWHMRLAAAMMPPLE